MSSGFSGGGRPDFYTGVGGITTGRSNPMMSMNNQQLPYRSPLTGIQPDPAAQIVNRGPDLIGKRSLAEFQQQQQQFQQQQVGLEGLYSNLRYVKPRYSLPVVQQFRPQQRMMSNMTTTGLPSNGNNIMPLFGNKFPSNSNVSFPNLLQNHRAVISMGQELLSSPQDQTEKKMMNRLHELEKQLLDDDDNEGGGGDAVSVITNSEWSDTINSLNLIGSTTNEKAISPSPTSSTSSCSSTSASPPITCPKQSINEVATAISEGKTEVATEILTRLSQVSNVIGTPEQRLTAYMTSALRSRVNPTDYQPAVSELYNKEHTHSTQMLYEASPCFKLGFMAANLAILEAISDRLVKKLHIIDFDIGQGGQYVHLLHALSTRKENKPSVLKITTFMDFVNGEEERLKKVGDGLKALANKIGVCLSFTAMSLNICDLSPEKLGVESDDALAVNFAFRLYKLPDESVTTENLRDELLRRFKGLSPKVVTVVEQEINANTAPFVARVNEACGYYGVLFDSLDATVSRENPERVKIEEGLGRKIANSVACEGRDRIERCEVFGKWRARMSMAGFAPKPMSPLVADSLRSKLNSGTRGNPGFTVNEQSGGICFGWMGRTLTVASAWS